MFKVDKSYELIYRSRTIRFPNELFKQLEKIANENHISVNSLVPQCCQYAIEKLDEAVLKKHKN